MMQLSLKPDALDIVGTDVVPILVAEMGLI